MRDNILKMLDEIEDLQLQLQGRDVAVSKLNQIFDKYKYRYDIDFMSEFINLYRVYFYCPDDIIGDEIIGYVDYIPDDRHVKEDEEVQQIRIINVVVEEEDEE